MTLAMSWRDAAQSFRMTFFTFIIRVSSVSLWSQGEEAAYLAAQVEHEVKNELFFSIHVFD